VCCFLKRKLDSYIFFNILCVLIILLSIVYFFNIQDNSLVFTIFVLYLLFFLPIGGSFLFCYIGQLAADSEMQITDSIYYCPGWRPSVHKLKIEEDGISMWWSIIDSKGRESGIGSKFEKISYKKIKSIYYRKLKLFNRIYTSIDIETKDKRRGHVNLIAHPKRVVIYYLVKYLKPNWKKIFKGTNDH